MTLCSQTSGHLILSFLIVAAAMSAAQAEQRKITVRQARDLVYEAVKDHNKGAEVDRIENPYDREFYYFEVIVPNAVASPVVGHFAVNPWTGDVWNPALCERIVLRALRKPQENIRRRSGLSQSEYRIAEKKRPICSNN